MNGRGVEEKMPAIQQFEFTFRRHSRCRQRHVFLSSLISKDYVDLTARMSCENLTITDSMSFGL